MKACGLVVEYNPFHNGHVLHARESREKTGADVVVAVMSGPFLQRGEPAIELIGHRTEGPHGHQQQSPTNPTHSSPRTHLVTTV